MIDERVGNKPSLGVVNLPCEKLKLESHSTKYQSK